MPWDVFCEFQTGEWAFTGNRDLRGVSGDALIQQRIAMRIRTELGSFIYDPTGSFGSRVNLALTYTPDRAERELPALVKEALAPMSDIQVVNITVAQNSDNPTRMDTTITYQALGTDSPSEFTTSLPIS